MKIVCTTLVIIIIGVIALTSCGKKQTQLLPLSYQATFVESSSTGESMVRATGKGEEVDDAVLDAKKAGIWFLLNAGDKPLLKSAAEKDKFKTLEQDIYGNPDVFIRSKSDIKGKRQEGDFTYVDLVLKIDINALKEKLVAAQVISSTEEVSESVGMPAIAVLAPKQDAAHTGAISVFQEYLTDRDFEVFVAEQSAKVDSIVNKVAGFEGAATDPLYAMALQLGCDVYIKVNANVSQGSAGGQVVHKAAVAVEAFETTTAKLIGSTTGYSPERKVSGYDALIQEAANDAADKLTSQITKSWTKQAEGGKPFKIVVFASEKDGSQVDSAVYQGLKSMSKKPIKRVAGGKTSFSYLAYLKGAANAFELSEQLISQYRGPGTLKKVMDKGAMLILKGGSDDESIEIQ